VRLSRRTKLLQSAAEPLRYRISHPKAGRREICITQCPLFRWKVKPRGRSFHHPAMPSRRLGAVDARAGDPRLDGAPARRPSALRKVAALVGMELGRSMPRSVDAVAGRRHGIDQFFKDAAVVDVCRGEPEGERDAIEVGNGVALGPCPAAICRIGAGLPAPSSAGTPALSTQARLRSMAPARPRRSSRTR
jgi:hypothetical protein